MQSDKTQTHHYDGNLKKELLLIRDFLEKCITIEDKKDIVILFMHDVLKFHVKEKDTASINYLHMIVDQWEQPDNYDPTNDVHAEDLLYICAIEFNNMKKMCCPNNSITDNVMLQEFCIELFIQLSDLQTGPCPQGRTTRLWQIVYGYYEHFKQ